MINKTVNADRIKIPRVVANESNPSVRLNELMIKIETIIEKTRETKYGNS
tara:strand:- start:2 stop:151 length:150 start_codon:yes stop_codon:yes gene_type:complete